MAEIEARPLNGFIAASTFSGCGGSCLGYRMAGFDVRWANEFIPAAQDTYRLNHPTTYLDVRDIRKVRPHEILLRMGMGQGDLDLFDGSPPCASFSTAGSREDGWGQVKKYSDTFQRTDDLFNEYIRILTGLQPKVFVAENVSGLVKGTAIGYFKIFIEAMRSAGYVVAAELLDASRLGVPQTRQRIIYVGVRNDIAALGYEPVFPKPLPYTYSVQDAIPYIRAGRFGGEWKGADRPSPTISAQVSYAPKTSTQGLEIIEAPAVTEAEAKEASIAAYAIGDEWEKLAPGEKGKYFNLIKARPDKPSPALTAKGGDNTAASVVHPFEKRKFYIHELLAIGGFPPDFQLTGTWAQKWERIGRAVPPIMMERIAIEIRDQILTPLKEKNPDLWKA